MRFSLLTLSLLLFLSCDAELVINPLDEDSTEYVEPETTITITDLDGSTLDTPSVTITFEGNDLVVEYAYSLNGGGYSDWIADAFVTLSYLDEGSYTFSVKGRYASGDEDDTPATASFTVDAIHGPALIFYPRQHILSVGSTATFQIKAYEVESLMLATITIAYDNTLIDIESVSQGDMFTGSGESIFIDEISTSSLTIYTMLLGGDTPSVSGTGVLATLKVKAKALGSATLSLDGTQVFKNNEDRSISIEQTVNGLVVIY